jgi:DNA-binding response OmpR family regulator
MHKILIIDDEETLLKNIGDFFKVKGYDVFSSSDGDAGIELLKSQSLDLLLLDLHLKDGPTGIQILRASKKIRPDLKVIMFTGFGDEEEMMKDCISNGADSFLTKPTSLKKIEETIENLLEKK